MAKVLIAVMAAAMLASAVSGQPSNPKKGAPILIQSGNTTKLIWKTSPPHPDAVMCCGGTLQLSWSPMDSGVDHSVVLNIDDTCPSTLKNQQYVQYIYQAAPRGLVTLDFNQNGDYYISDAVANHCSQQGMQFLLAVRGCPADNTIYTPVVPINVQCRQPSSALGLPGAAGVTPAPLSPMQQQMAALQQQRAQQLAAGGGAVGGMSPAATRKAAAAGNGAAGGRGAAAAAVAAAAGAAVLLAGL